MHNKTTICQIITASALRDPFVKCWVTHKKKVGGRGSIILLQNHYSTPCTEARTQVRWRVVRQADAMQWWSCSSSLVRLHICFVFVFSCLQEKRKDDFIQCTVVVVVVIVVGIAVDTSPHHHPTWHAIPHELFLYYFVQSINIQRTNQ